MKLDHQIEKLREQRKLILESLRQAEYKASIRHRKEQVRAKIILGGALLSMPLGEREALLSMLTPHLNERERRFVSEHLASG